MPYDPRPVSQGGNRGIDEEFSRVAPNKIMPKDIKLLGRLKKVTYFC